MRLRLTTQTFLSISAALLLLTPAARAAPTGDRKCEAAKNEAAGSYGRCLGRAARVLTISEDEARFARIRQKCRARFDAAWAKADSLGTCGLDLSRDDLAARLELLADDTSSLAAGVRFVDTGETIVDLRSGLEWEKKDDAGGIHDRDAVFAWGDVDAPFAPNGAAFTDFLASLNGAGDGECFAGHCDWRLPTREELSGIVDRSSSPAVPSDFWTSCYAGCELPACSCTVSQCYWSASTFAFGGSFAWGTYFYDGTENVTRKDMAYPVRAVRDRN